MRSLLNLLDPVPSPVYMLSSAPEQGKQTTFIRGASCCDPSFSFLLSLFRLSSFSRLGNQTEEIAFDIVTLYEDGAKAQGKAHKFFGHSSSPLSWPVYHLTHLIVYISIVDSQRLEQHFQRVLPSAKVSLPPLAPLTLQMPLLR